MEVTPKVYSISEAARELGLSAEWLRQGEKRGSLPLARRDRNGHRYYTLEDTSGCTIVGSWSVTSDACRNVYARAECNTEGRV
jgi:hypothetical protein